MERFACPTPDRMGRYLCIDDHVLCDGFIDCPSGEDEDRHACMFYKTVCIKRSLQHTVPRPKTQLPFLDILHILLELAFFPPHTLHRASILDLCYPGILRSINWQFLTDVSVQPICHIFKG